MSLPSTATTRDQGVRDIEQRGGLLDHLARRRPLAAVDHRVGDDRAQPVEEVDDLVARDAGEEVLVPAGEAHDLVREDRAEDQERVVVEDQLVEPDVHLFAEKAAADFRDLVGGDLADGGERLGLVPLVVEEPHGGVLALALADRHGEPLADLPLGQRLVRPEGDQAIDRLGLRLEAFVEQLEDLADRAGAGVVRNNHQDPLAGVVVLCKELAHGLTRLTSIHGTVFVLSFYNHVPVTWKVNSKFEVPNPKQIQNPNYRNTVVCR